MRYWEGRGESLAGSADAKGCVRMQAGVKCLGRSPYAGVRVEYDDFGRMDDSHDPRSSLLWYLEVYPTLSDADKP